MLSWAVAESSVYLIASCLPMMRPIFVSIAPRWLVSQLRTVTDTSAAYHPRGSSKRASVPARRRTNPRNFSRLHDPPEPCLSPVDAEKGVSTSDAAVTRVPTAAYGDIPMQTLQRESIAKTVDVTVEHAPVSPVSPR